MKHLIARMALNDPCNDRATFFGKDKEYEGNLSPRKANALNPHFSEDLSSWLSSVKSYITETGAKSLDLKARGLSANEVKLILELLQNTQVVELDLEKNYLKGGIKTISEALVQSKIKKLSIRYCEMLDAGLIDFMEILNATEITDLDASYNGVDDVLDDDDGQKIVAALLKSRLSILRLGFSFIFDHDNITVKLFAEGLPNTSITCLDLAVNVVNVSHLVSKLSQTSITELNLTSIDVNISDLKVLSENLKDSKLEKLDLSGNEISDAGINVLVQGLKGSKIIDLNLNSNDFSGSNNLGHYLRGSKIRTLNIGSNLIKQRRMFSFPHFLKGTTVVTLDISLCNLGDQLGQEVMRSLESTTVRELNISRNELDLMSIFKFANSDMNVVKIDFSRNEFSAETFVILGDCLKDSKLECIDVSGCCKPSEALGFFYFLECTKNTGVVSVKMAVNNLGTVGGKLLAKVLRGTSFTHLDVSYNELGGSVSNLASHLSLTNITHLNLSNNHLRDGAAEALAGCLKNSQIVELDISDNFITSEGAEALAFSLEKSNLLCLKLFWNKIETDGLEALAKHAESTFITTLEVHHNPGDRILMVDAVLWKNRASVHKLVSLFKNIARNAVGKGSCFDFINDSKNVKNLIENWLVFYKTALKNQHSAATVLAQEESIPFHREQILTALRDFPEVLASFVSKEIEADVAQHVDLLEKAEQLGLTNIVERLLLNRPVYVIDEMQNILHPRVYTLLHKYKQPVCNVGVEPQGKEKIMEYFKEHTNLEGALDVIALIQKASPV